MEITKTEVSDQPDSRGYYTIIEHLADGSKVSYEVFASKARIEALTKNKQAKRIADAVADTLKVATTVTKDIAKDVADAVIKDVIKDVKPVSKPVI